MPSIEYLLGEVYRLKDIWTLARDCKSKATRTTLYIRNIYKSKILIVLLLFSNVSFPRKLGDAYNIKSLNSLFLTIENGRCNTAIACKSFNRNILALKLVLLATS